jgi:hypothetical protein
MPARRFRIALLLPLSAVLWAADPFVTQTSTETVPAPRPVKRKGQPSLKKLKDVGEKVLTPNPRFQEPQPQPMPIRSPKTPKLETSPETAPTQAERFFRGAARVMTWSWRDNIFVWLPAISTDPNTGPTYGIMPVLVLSDSETKHIRHLVAPSYTYNELFKQTVTGRYYFYPTDESQLYAVGSYSQQTNREIKLRYEDTAFLGGRAFVRAEGYYDIDGSLRFFGLGPASRESDEAGYTGKDKVLRAAMGVNFFESMRFTTGFRYRWLEVDHNIIDGVDDLVASFPGTPGIDAQETVVQEFRVLWDTRDFAVTPSQGRSGEIFFEKTSQGWGSESDFIRYGLEGKRFIPWNGGKQITALHGLFDQANGPDIPFYEQAMLGGRETLRGYGEGRFYDRGRIVINVEQRIEITSLALMGVVTRFEAGPFIDVGTVFPRLGDAQWKHVRPVFGGSFRAAVKPNVVGSVDVGVGKEGPGVYVGISYPF